MASTALGDEPRHRGEHRLGWRRRVWTVVATLVVVGAVIGIVVEAKRDVHTSDRDPVISLPGPPQVYPDRAIGGVLTLTDSCLSLPDGLVVWPYGTTWDAQHQVVHLLQHDADWKVGSESGYKGTLLPAIPSTPSETVPQSMIDALQACSRATGIRSVAFLQ